MISDLSYKSFLERKLSKKIISLKKTFIFFVYCRHSESKLSNTKRGTMKRITYVLVIVFTLGMLLASCNRKSCPAYSQNDQEQTENYQG